MGGMIGSYIAENYPDSKIAIVEGTLGQGIVELFEEGFEANLGPNNEIVLEAPADWNAEKVQNIMSDWLTNYDGEFDMVYAMNADIYLGVVRALEDAGLLNNPIKIITHNGRPEDFEGVMEGKAIATNSNSPTYESGVLLKTVTEALQGNDVPELVITPATMVDIDTPENLLGWEVEKGITAYQEYDIYSGGNVDPNAAAPAEEETMEEEAMGEGETFEIGYIQYSSDAYYQMQADAAELVVDYINENEPFDVEMTFVTSEAQPERELAHIEDFIAQGYDAIIDFTGAAETAQRGAQLANDAGIPFFVVGSTAADGPGKVTSTVKGDFGVMGGMIGSYIAENFPDAKIAIVQGTLGQGIAELFQEGFEANLGPNNEVVLEASGEWNAERSQNIMSDWLANYDGEFDMVYAQNADIYLGVVRALEDAGLLNNPIRIITHNGRPEDFQGVMEGKAVATNANSPTYEAGVLMKTVLHHLLGIPVPELVITPATMVDIDTPENLLGWEVEKGITAYQEYEIPTP